MLPVSAPPLLGSNFAVSVTDCLGVRVCGVVTPDTLKSFPFELTEVITTLSAPSSVNFSVCVDGLPSLTFPKLTGDGVTLNKLVAPFPFRVAIIAGPCDAVVTEMFPLTWPADVGANAAVSFRVWPGCKTIGPEKPVIENSEPVAEICESVTFLVPRLATITGWLAFEPTPTLPKSIAFGVRWSPAFDVTDGFPEKPMQPEVASIPKSASDIASALATFAARFAITRRTCVTAPSFGVKTRFMSDCILRERTCGRLLARGTRWGQGGSSIWKTAISHSTDDRFFATG